MIDCNYPLVGKGITIIIDPLNNTKYDAVITFYCEESGILEKAVCGSNGEWSPNISSLMCVNGTLGTALLLY